MDPNYQQGGYQQPYQQQAYEQPYQQQAYQQQAYQQPYQQAYVQEAPAMGFVDAIKSCFSKYATFSGRATRAEFWWWLLFTCIIIPALCIIPFIGFILAIIVWLGSIIPSMAVVWRRLHDTGKAGGWVFLSLVPFGGIVLLVWWCTKSEPMDNRFGPYLG